ncbi:MAG: phosphate ABC transporter substrate-binding protein [Ignavibacteriales bacterium]|nr:phosphate ABC transporter substrate-binding protein [Ignavibacteriales bacterium]OGU83871.1 MAG: phosphate-binding protein [Stygiobacter sp. RIFOXYA12_FULL_38_9]OGV06344.1 MAG: phosphate-binding protein [Stygiobacter sp. RIFOXYB2_FULL_37_11]OGV11047.1 MAG: phosphate-binding protein [Stygiobacter sp. RIFOXYA2_FULL_38_8]OGV15458.1 MAG: phosphate-binding protein [Stygiobacter sp. RIFOXYC2_FULL_38_25]OGV25317.1 MAG: phosphate-binding protein [Stygiobacter sp. RIFOXYC12_FULL_38_8]OGV80572.1 MAG
MKKIILLLVIATMAFGFTYDNKVITVKGSDTMVILAQRWAEKYMESHPGITIQVTGGGSGIGLAALINGSTDIANASRPMKPSEREKLKQRYNSLGVEVKTAKDGLSVYLNEKNSVKELSIQQIKDIYTGKITNWKDVGGKDAKIIVYGRENSSGTYVYFKDNVLGGQDFTSTMQSMPGTSAVVNAIVKDANSIGFGGAAYAKGIKFAAVKKDATSKAYIPTEENIKSGNYPITRYLYLYLKTRPSGEMKDYIDWILSAEGQSIVTKVGYFPVR